MGKGNSHSFFKTNIFANGAMIGGLAGVSSNFINIIVTGEAFELKKLIVDAALGAISGAVLAPRAATRAAVSAFSFKLFGPLLEKINPVSNGFGADYAEDTTAKTVEEHRKNGLKWGIEGVENGVEKLLDEGDATNQNPSTETNNQSEVTPEGTETNSQSDTETNPEGTSEDGTNEKTRTNNQTSNPKIQPIPVQ